MNAKIPTHQTMITASAIVTEPHGSRVATQEFVLTHDPGTPIASMMGNIIVAIREQGGLVERVSEDKLVLYPAASLDAITFQANKVVGVSALGTA